MLEAGIKTLDEVKKDVHVDLTNMNKSINLAPTTSNAADVEMISKLLEGGTAFKGEMSLMMMMDDDDDDDDDG